MKKRNIIPLTIKSSRLKYKTYVISINKISSERPEPSHILEKSSHNLMKSWRVVSLNQMD